MKKKTLGKERSVWFATSVEGTQVFDQTKKKNGAKEYRRKKMKRGGEMRIWGGRSLKQNNAKAHRGLVS